MIALTILSVLDAAESLETRAVESSKRPPRLLKYGSHAGRGQLARFKSLRLKLVVVSGANNVQSTATLQTRERLRGGESSAV